MLQDSATNLKVATLVTAWRAREEGNVWASVEACLHALDRAWVERKAREMNVLPMGDLLLLCEVSPSHLRRRFVDKLVSLGVP